MKQLNKFLAERPVTIYYLTTFLISWGGLVMILGGTDKITSAKSDAPFFPLYFITVAGPFIAGILLTGFYNGIQGYRELLLRFLKCRVPFKWYAITLLIPPLSVFTALF